MPSKAVERAVLDQCRKNVPRFPLGQVVERESPDFHVLSGDRVTGVEMQEFIQGAGVEGAAGRKDESLRAMVMTTAQKTFEAVHPGVFLYVYGHWGRRSGDRKYVPELAQQLATLVSKLVPPPPLEGKYVSHRYADYDELKAAGLVNCLTTLDVGLYPPATYGLWASPEWGLFSQDLNDMQVQVRAKELKVETYRRSCSELWLVLYGLALPSGYFDIDVLQGVHMKSAFDHVVFIDAVSDRNVALTG
jgi:hypothetical protein